MADKDETGAIAEAPEKTAADAAENMEEGDLIQSLLARQTTTPPETEESKETPAAEAEDDPEKDAEAEVEQQEEESEEDIETEAGIDLESLTEEQWSAIAEHLNSRAASRIGKLTRRAKEAEEALQTTRAEQSKSNPLEGGTDDEEPIPDSVAKIEDLGELQKQYQDLGKSIEAGEDLLDEHEEDPLDMEWDDADGNTWTRRTLKARLKAAKKTRETWMPAQAKALEVKAQAKQIRESLEEQAPKELPWLAEDENPIRAEFEANIATPEIQAMMEAHPSAKYILAHACNSIVQLRDGKGTPATAKPEGKISKPDPKPPAAPKSAARKTERPDSTKTKQAQQLQRAFESDGSEESLARLLTFQMEH